MKWNTQLVGKRALHFVFLSRRSAPSDPSSAAADATAAATITTSPFSYIIILLDSTTETCVFVCACAYYIILFFYSRFHSRAGLGISVPCLNIYNPSPSSNTSSCCPDAIACPAANSFPKSFLCLPFASTWDAMIRHWRWWWWWLSSSMPLPTFIKYYIEFLLETTVLI